MQVRKNGVCLALDCNQTTLQMFQQALRLKSLLLPSCLHADSDTINLLTYNTTAFPHLLSLASTGCRIQNKDTAV